MRQRLALIAIEKNNVARLRPAVCAIAGAGRPVRPRRRSGVPSACAAVAANGTFFSQRLGQLRTADANTLARFDLGAQAGDRPIAPVGHRFSNKGVTTRNAASLFTGAGPGATLAFSASIPPPAKSLRHRRTVSSRTPNASAIRDWSSQSASTARRAPSAPSIRASRVEGRRSAAVGYCSSTD